MNAVVLRAQVLTKELDNLTVLFLRINASLVKVFDPTVHSFIHVQYYSFLAALENNFFLDGLLSNVAQSVNNKSLNLGTHSYVTFPLIHQVIV